MRDTAGEVGTNSCGPLLMDKQRLDDQLEPTYSSSVQIGGVAPKTCWTTEKGGEKRSGISVLMAPHDNDDTRGAYDKFPDFFRMDI